MSLIVAKQYCSICLVGKLYLQCKGFDVKTTYIGSKTYELEVVFALNH